MSKRYTSGTQSQSHFAKAVHANVPRSTFYRNSTLKTTFNSGVLVPVYCDEILPADTFEMDLASVIRTSTMLFPVMDEVQMTFWAFFVPNRIVMDGWEELNGENKTSAWTPANEPPPVPCYDGTNVGSGSALTYNRSKVGAYYGLPKGFNFQHVLSVGRDRVSVLPYRGYVKIWNDWYRDQNYQAPMPLNTGNTVTGVDQSYAPFTLDLLPVRRRRDYFSSCLPAPQKGTSVVLPLTGNAPVRAPGPYVPVMAQAATFPYSAPVAPAYSLVMASGINEIAQGSNVHNSMRSIDYVGREPGFTAVVGRGWGALSGGGTSYGQLRTGPDVLSGEEAEQRVFSPVNLGWSSSGVYADMSAVSAATVNELRFAFQMQKMLERDARGGSRYIEMLKSHFGVTADDYRLQRPELLGVDSFTLNVSQVAQTSESSSTSDLADLSAYSLTNRLRRGFLRKTFVEHGLLHIFVEVRHTPTYINSMERFLTRSNRLDYFLPVFSNIGEQPVYNYEIYHSANTTASKLGQVWGYNEAWADYRYKPNRINGMFTESGFNAWHYGTDIANGSTLVYDSNFVKTDTYVNMDRTLATPHATTNVDQLIADIAFRCKATRPMPVHSVPSLIDHF